jgi:hypothetical protein
MSRLTQTLIAGGLAALAAGVAACGGSTTSSTVAPSGPVTTVTFNGTINPGGLAVYSFQVTSPGAISVTMTSAGPPATITMGLGIGNPDASGNCIFLSGGTTQAVASTTTPQLTGTLTSSGAYCVEIADVGNAAGPITYSIAVSHT